MILIASWVWPWPFHIYIIHSLRAFRRAGPVPLCPGFASPADPVAIGGSREGLWRLKFIPKGSENGRKTVPEGPWGVLWGLCEALGGPWGPLGGPWGGPWGSLGFLGGSLGGPWGVLGGSLGILGVPWGSLGVLGGPWGVPGGPGGILGANNLKVTSPRTTFMNSKYLMVNTVQHHAPNIVRQQAHERELTRAQGFCKLFV